MKGFERADVKLQILYYAMVSRYASKANSWTWLARRGGAFWGLLG